MLFAHFLAGTGVDPSALVQYGAVGIIAALALLAVGALFRRLEAQFESREQERERELQRAIARADRMELELDRINAATRDSMRAMAEANRAVAEAMTRMRRDP